MARPLAHLANRADLLLLAGDLTQTGKAHEGQVLADELRDAPLPVIAVLGNHDYHADEELEIGAALRDAGVTVLDREIAILELAAGRVGIVGATGFGGGFSGACATDFGEREMKSFVRHTAEHAAFIRRALREIETDYKIVLMHYSPVADTLHGEKREIYPFLGSYLLGEAVDDGGADLVFHGHAHSGVEKGTTPGGIPVRNVAQPVIRHVFNIYTLDKQGIVRPAEAGAPESKQMGSGP
jgi:Icc-related predicted phosphoesterase